MTTKMYMVELEVLKAGYNPLGYGRLGLDLQLD